MRFLSSVVNILCIPLHLIHAVGLSGIYKRIFPICINRMAKSYNKKMHDKKKDLFCVLPEFKKAGGQLTILEIGCGTGANFEFYPPGSRLICTDPNPHFEKYLTETMTKNDHLRYERFVVASGEDLRAVEDDSIDVVVCTLVLCSVDDVSQTLREAHRILRPVSGLCSNYFRLNRVHIKHWLAAMLFMLLFVLLLLGEKKTLRILRVCRCLESIYFHESYNCRSVLYRFNN